MTATIGAYDEHAEAWAARHSVPGFWQDGHDMLRKVLTPPARIIEFGTGAGMDALTFLADGYQYTGVDPSSELRKIAERNVPGITIWPLALDEFTLPSDTEPFDGFWSAATLLHIPKAQISQVLANISGTLKPAAPGFITLKAGQGEGEESAPDVPSPRFFAYWEEGEFRDALDDAGFSVLEYRSRFGSERWDWHQFLVEKL